MRLDRLTLLNIFVAVVDSGGLAGAARKLNISPSAVTRAVQELEAHLGAQLLTRTTRVVRATEAGTAYVDECRRILNELAEAEKLVAGLQSEPRGHITVTAPGWFGSLYVTPVVAEYLQRHPGVTATCLFLDRVVNMVDEGVDVAIRIAKLADSSLRATRVGSMRVVVCASPSYLDRYGIPKTPNELAQHATVSGAGVTPGLAWRLTDKGGRQHTAKLQPRLTAMNNETAVAAAVAGLGLTQQMIYKVAEPLRAGLLKIALSDYEPQPLPVNVIHREGRHASPKVRMFLDLLIARLQALPVLR